MGADKYGRIPEKESSSVAWNNFLKDVLSFFLKVKHSICVAEMLNKHAFNSWDRIFNLVSLQDCYIETLKKDSCIKISIFSLFLAFGLLLP